MKSRIALLLPASLLLFAATASAQLRQGTVEINGFGGWLFGGEIAHAHDVFNNDFDHNHVDVGDDAAYGGRIGYNITSLFEVESEYSRTETDYILRLHNAPDQNLGNLTVEYFMAYCTFNFGHHRVVPFFTVGAGAARLDPNLPGTFAESDVRFTSAVGSGVKIFFTPHFAMRFDARFYSTWLGDNSRVFCDTNNFCDTRNWMGNVTTTGGFLVAF
ncbi:MAG TPA: outer membrane beta-barrel protein [Thermoanaerobaculia bacterium]|jgi:opacity protein-like surface antigen